MTLNKRVNGDNKINKHKLMQTTFESVDQIK